MNSIFTIDCDTCNRQAEVNEEKKQEKHSQSSFVSYKLQNCNQQRLPPHKHHLNLIAKLESKKPPPGIKLSLKSPQKSNIRMAKLANTSSMLNVSEATCEERFKSPPPKIIITYRPNSSPTSYNSYQQEQYQQESKANFWNISKYKENFEPFRVKQMINRQNNELTQQQFESKNVQNQVNEYTIYQQEYTENLSKNNYSILEDNTKIFKHKRVHFSEFKQNLQKADKNQQTYSAIVSLASTLKDLSNRYLHNLSSSEKTVPESNQDFIKFSVIKEEFCINQVRRAPKKNLTFFKQEQKKLASIRMVNTIKSIDTPSQRSFLDLSFMQKLQKGTHKRLLS